jgi:urease accessory protein
MMMDIQPFPAHDGRFPRLIQPPPEPPALERARGHARLSFYKVGGETRLVEFYQSGSAKIRLPRVTAGVPKEAVFLNTAGGVTGGDRLVYEVAAGAGTRLVVTTQAAERIYRRSLGTAEIETGITVDDGAELAWLPQETILFDNSALSRRLSADVGEGATLLAVEAIVLGRAAMGETARNVIVNDAWRVRRGGKLIFADGLRLSGDAAAIMAGKATGDGAAALATLLLVAPDAEARIEAAREALGEGQGEGGASAWNGMLVARLSAPTGQVLRSDLQKLIERLRGAAMPRVWNS